MAEGVSCKRPNLISSVDGDGYLPRRLSWGLRSKAQQKLHDDGSVSFST